jgi:hypothetical protein
MYNSSQLKAQIERLLEAQIKTDKTILRTINKMGSDNRVANDSNPKMELIG